MDLIAAGFDGLGGITHDALPAGLLQSFIQNGVIPVSAASSCSLPQILILFLFILLLEDLGYMARAAFLMDRIMGSAGCMVAPSSRCCRALPVPFGHHGDPSDRRSARPADDHHGRAADDLLGTHSGLHADHLGIHPLTSRSGAGSACKAW